MRELERLEAILKSSNTLLLLRLREEWVPGVRCWSSALRSRRKRSLRSWLADGALRRALAHLPWIRGCRCICLSCLVNDDPTRTRASHRDRSQSSRGTRLASLAQPHQRFDGFVEVAVRALQYLRVLFVVVEAHVSQCRQLLIEIVAHPRDFHPEQLAWLAQRWRLRGLVAGRYGGQWPRRRERGLLGAMGGGAGTAEVEGESFRFGRQWRRLVVPAAGARAAGVVSRGGVSSGQCS